MHRFRTSAASLLLALALPAGGAWAAVQEFGPGYGRFTVDVPRGWYAHEIEHGVSIAPDDSTAFIALTATKARGSAAAEASALARETGLGQLREERPGTWSARGSVSGRPALCRVTVSGGIAYAATLLGRDMARLEAIAATFAPLAPGRPQRREEAGRQEAPRPAAPAASGAPGTSGGQPPAAQPGSAQRPADRESAAWGPSFHRFAARLPEGWTAEATASGLVATPPHRKTACFLEMQANAEHLDGTDLARAYARDSGLKGLADYPAGSRQGRRCLKGRLEGEPALACIELRGRHYLGLVAAGRGDASDGNLEEGLGLMDAVRDLPAK